METIQEFYEIAGGSINIALATKSHQFNVDRWVKIGIPVWYWAPLMEHFDVTVEELYRMTIRAKTENDKLLAQKKLIKEQKKAKKEASNRASDDQG
jgi:hypothetical protein